MEGVKAKQAKLDRYPELAMNYSDETADEMARLQDEIDAENLWDLDSQIDVAMEALRCPPDDADVDSLSGGERRRVALCKLLLEQPDMLLLDEPTSALDASIQAEVLNLLERLRAERGLTYVLVSHDLAVVAHMCERLMVMQHGRTVEELTRDALRRHEARESYTRTLLAASEGYTPLAAPAS